MVKKVKKNRILNTDFLILLIQINIKSNKIIRDNIIVINKYIYQIFRVIIVFKLFYLVQ